MSKLVFKNQSTNEAIEPKVSEVVNQNGGGSLKFWYGTQEQYNTLAKSGTVAEDTIYFIKEPEV